MVGVARIELATPAMSTQCSTTELHAHEAGYLATRSPAQPCWPEGDSAFEARQPDGYNLPCWSSVWNMRSTSATRSRRWKGLDSTLASGAALPGLERDRGEAGDEHHPHVGRDLRRLLGELDAVHLGHDDVGEQQVEALASRAAAAPRCRDRPRSPHSRPARARGPDRRASTRRLRREGS